MESNLDYYKQEKLNLTNLCQTLKNTNDDLYSRRYKMRKVIMIIPND